MFYTTITHQYENIQYVSIDNVVKNQKIAYNTCNINSGDNMLNKEKNNIFTPNNDDMNAAKKRLQERLKKGTSKGYNKYFKKLMSSYSDVRKDG